MTDKTKGCTCDSSPCPDRLLTQKEAAEILSVSPLTLEAWRWQGKGPKYIKIGKLARYRESDIYAFIEKLAEKA